MALISEKPVSAETEKQIEDAFNAITKAQFKTMVDLRFFTEEEYYGKVKEMLLKAGEEGEDNSSSAGAESGDGAVEDETVMNEEYNYAEVVYPEIKENQLDIIFISGIDMYKEFSDEGYLERLEDQLSAGSKVLSDYILNEYMSAVKLSGGTYAIPNNTIASDYTYLLLNKELVEKYQYTEQAKTWLSVADANSFIMDISKYEDKVVPVYGDVVPTNTHYWSYDIGSMGEVKTFNHVPNRFSVLGCTLNEASVGNEGILSVTKLLSESSAYGKQLLAIQALKDANCIKKTIDKDEKFAVGFIKGNEMDVAEYREDYEVIVTEYPRLTHTNVFSSMFGVNADSRFEASRSMEIITYLNTNSELRNILQYGIENVHYEIDAKTDVLKRLNQDYMMDVNKTGNVFMAHAEEGIDPSVMKSAIAQNRDALLYPGIAYSGTSNDKVFDEYVTKLEDLSKKYAEKIDACKSVEELKTIFAECNKDLDTDRLYTNWINTAPSDEKFSPYAAYYTWAVDSGFINPDGE